MVPRFSIHLTTYSSRGWVNFHPYCQPVETVNLLLATFRAPSMCTCFYFILFYLFLVWEGKKPYSDWCPMFS
jgi:hypothetical protein